VNERTDEGRNEAVKKKMTEIMLTALVVLALAAPAVFGDWQTKYATSGDADDPAVTFAPNPAGATVVKSIQAKVAGEDGTLSVYAGNGYKAQILKGVASSGTNLTVAQSSAVTITNGDTVVVVGKDGYALYSAVNNCSTGTIYLDTALGSAVTNGSYVYEVTLQGSIPFAGDRATVLGVTQVWMNVAGEALWATSGDSPLYIVAGSTTGATLQVTVEK
jgi:hypothetical protein